MTSFKAYCLAGVASVAVTAVAHAADLPMPLPPPPPYIESAAPIGNGWYLRGDVGAGALQLRDSYSSFGTDYGTANGAPPGFAYQGAYAEEQAFVGGGVGYQINSYFRADVTGEYRFGTKYHATETAYGCGAGNCVDAYSGRISNAVFLVNGYVDMGTWYGITPYLGAGIGTSINTFSGLTDYQLDAGGSAQGTAASKTRASLAYAGMAGISYAITPNLKLDFGYRYLDMGRVASDTISCTAGCSYEKQHFHLASHDVRIGLRYQFADLIPYAAPPVLVRKY